MTAESISKVLLEQFKVVCSPEKKADKDRLIVQVVDGAHIIRAATGGMKRKSQAIYPNAPVIHCYAHKINLVMQDLHLFDNFSVLLFL